MKNKFNGGYVTILLGKLAQVLAARIEKKISFTALRVYLAAFEMVAKRCMAPNKVHYTTKELAKLIGIGENQAIKALKELENEGLLSFTETSITFHDNELSPEAAEIASSCNTSTKRPIPIPRRILRALFRHTKPTEVIAALAHCIRCLFKSGDKIKNQGLVKSTWIAEVFGISVRSVHAARAWLIGLGFLKPVEVHQKIVNRYGGCFKILAGKKGRISTSKSHESSRDLESKDVEVITCSQATEEPEEPLALEVTSEGVEVSYCTQVEEVVPEQPMNLEDSKTLEVCPCTKAEELKAEPLIREERAQESRVGENLKNPKSAPPSLAQDFADPNRKFAGPYKTRSSKEDMYFKNHKPGKPRPRSGVQKDRISIRNVTLEDLKSTPRVLELYRQATEAGWLNPSEANQVNFLAAAVRAKRQSGNPVKIFVGIVKKHLWHHITQIQESLAIEALKRYRNKQARAQALGVKALIDSVVTS